MYETEYIDKSIIPPKAIFMWSSCLTKPALKSKNNIAAKTAKNNRLFDSYLKNVFIMYNINIADIRYKYM